MSDTIRDSIESTAVGPKRVRTDAGEVEAQSIQDQIAADKYLAAKNAVTASSTNRRRGLRFNQLTPSPFA
jgi:hypothetical protein